MSSCWRFRRDVRDFSLLYFGTFLARNQVVFERCEWCPLKPDETCCKCCESRQPRQSRYIAKCRLSRDSEGTLGTFSCYIDIYIYWNVFGKKKLGCVGAFRAVPLGVWWSLLQRPSKLVANVANQDSQGHQDTLQRNVFCLGFRRDVRNFFVLYFGTFLARIQVVFECFERCPLEFDETCCKDHRNLLHLLPIKTVKAGKIHYKEMSSF